MRYWHGNWQRRACGLVDAEYSTNGHWVLRHLEGGRCGSIDPPMTEPEELIRQIKEADASVLVTMSTWAGLAKQIQEGAGSRVVLTNQGDLFLPKYLISRWRNRGLDFRNALH